MQEAKNCKKGYPCRLTCIEKSDVCNNKLPREVHDTLESFYNNVEKTGLFTPELITESFNKKDSLSETQIKALSDLSTMIKDGQVSDDVITGITNFIVGNILYPEVVKGAKMAPLQDLQTLTKKGTYDKQPDKSRFDLMSSAVKKSKENKTFEPKAPGGVGDYVNNVVKLTDVPDKVVDIVWNIMGQKYQGKFRGAGMGTGRPAWTGENTYSTKERSMKRGKELVKRYIEQKGVSPYTGNVVAFNNAELEHISPLSTSKDANGNKIGDQPDNWAWVEKGLNLSHRELNPEKWKENVDSALSDPESYQKLYDKKQSESQSKLRKINDVSSSIEQALANDDAKMRVHLIYEFGKSLGDKSKKMLEVGGENLLVPQKLKMSYNKLQNDDGKNSPTLDKVKTPELKDWGNPKLKPSEIISMVLASLDDAGKQAFYDAYTANQSKHWSGDFANPKTHKALKDRVGFKEYSRMLDERLSEYNSGLNDVLNKFNVKIGESDVKTLINSIANTTQENK